MRRNKAGARSAAHSGGAIVQVRLTPRSSRDVILAPQNGVYHVKVTAPPVDGKANQALISLLSKALGVPKGRLELVSGEKSRHKTVRIRGMTGPEAESALAEEEA
jgi:uncharacterized protein